MKLKLNKTDKIIGGSILLLFAIQISIFVYNEIRLYRNGVYVIARLDAIKSAGNRGTDYYYNYYYKGSIYKASMRSIIREDSFVFIKLEVNNPMTSKILSDKVPACLTLDDVPAEG